MATATLDMHNVVSSVELANIIKTSASAIIANPALSHVIPPTLVRGAPGVGKSTIVKSVAAELGIDFIDMRLSEMERVDVAGLPSVDKGTTIWNVPSILPQNSKSKGILLLDEITAAPADVQVANMPANLENSAVVTGLEKVSFHPNPKERQCQRMLKLPHNCTHLTC